jgi:hypothetical protein
MAEQVDRIIIHHAEERDPETQRDAMNKAKPPLHRQHAYQDSGSQWNGTQQHQGDRSIAGIQKDQHERGGSRRQPPGFPFNGALDLDRKYTGSTHAQSERRGSYQRYEQGAHLLLDFGLSIGIEPSGTGLCNEQGF